MLSLRKVNLNDVELIFKWANDPDVRNNSFNTNQIVWDEHVKWFRGFGYGKKIVELGIEHLLNQNMEINTIEAHVKVNNKASQKVFNSLGFDKVFLEDECIFKKVFL